METKLDWVSELVKAEDQMEATGTVDLRLGFESDRYLYEETIKFLNQLKHEFIEAAGAFNQLKSSPLGRIKIYAVAQTQADFMLFRNGYKMIFAMKKPGEISVKFNFLLNALSETQVYTTQSGATKAPFDENVLTAKRGAFGELIWSFENREVRIAPAVRYYLTLFIRESAK
jgi:hypothetical protein